MTLTYLLSDHLGSTSLTSDSNGNKVSEIRYTAWGEVRYTWTDPNLNTSPIYALTRYTFTGQYSDSYINLLWYGSRHYDPELGRFISPDSIVPTATQGTQAYDRYGYANNNNPVRYNDPTGHMVDEGDGGNYTWQDQLHDATLIKRNNHDLCERGYDQYCSDPDLYIKHHPKPVSGVHWGYSVQAGLVVEKGFYLQYDYLIDWKTGTLYIVKTVGQFTYIGSPTGLDGAGYLGTTNMYGIPNDVDDISGFLAGPQKDYSGELSLDAGLLVGAERGLSIDLNPDGTQVYTPGAGYMYSTQSSALFAGDAVPNLWNGSVQWGTSESYIVGTIDLW